MYLLCRDVQYVTMRIEKDKGRRVENKVSPMVVGFSHFPEPGGALDQGHWMMSMFESFRQGENASGMKRLNK